MVWVFFIKKRDGRIVSYDRNKIYTAIKKAIIGAWGSDFSQIEHMVTKVEQKIQERLMKDKKTIPEVEMVQDIVEEVLIKEWHDTVAKAYILYREKRRVLRESDRVMVDVAHTMEEYLFRSDWRVHANANSWYSLWGLILNTSWKITANYWLSYVYPKEIGDLHRNGDFHIHDLDMLSWYCAWWSLRQLLEEWFNGLHNRVESSPPKNLQSAVNQMINFLGTLQNEWAWAQAFSSFDTYLAPFVHKYKKELLEELKALRVTFSSQQEKEAFVSHKVYQYVHQQMQNFIFWLNVPSRWGTQTPFTNITLDLVPPEDLKEKALFLWWVEKWPYEKKFWELQEEMNIINRVLVEIYTAWDAKGNVFTFPIPTYNVTTQFDWDSPIVDAIFEMTAKYGLPYFQNFIGSQYKRVYQEDGSCVFVKNENAYSPGAVRSMCCRLQLDLKELLKRGNGLFGSAEMTGSIGVVTLNCARIGYMYRQNKEAFFNHVYYLMQQAKTSLEIKRKVLTKWLEEWLFPYTRRYLHSFRNHFSTIGVNGMNEAILNFFEGKEDITTQTGIHFALEVLDFMREKLKEFQEETGNLYNLEATPAEWATYRFAKEDIKRFPNIIHAGTKEAPYYTNSTQLPVSFTDDIFEALDYQNELQCKYTGGTVFHVYLWERIHDPKACKALVKKILEYYQVPYITITPTFSICPKHGYLSWIHEYCPICDQEIGYVAS